METEIEINGVKYVKKTDQPSVDGMPAVIVRSKDSGAHFGFLKAEEGNTITLVNARRIWYWKGAASLSQLASSGTSSPSECKFPEPVQEIVIYGCCEKIAMTDEALKSLSAVPVWKA